MPLVQSEPFAQPAPTPAGSNPPVFRPTLSAGAPTAGGRSAFQRRTCGRPSSMVGGIARCLPPDAWESDGVRAEADQWDREAGRYEARRAVDPRSMAAVEAAVRAVGARPGEVVLDAGCGTGLVARRLAAAGARVTALDLSLKSLEYLRDRAPGPIELVQGDLTRVPFADDSFDRVVCANALQHIQGAAARASCVRELARVLRPGGTLVVTAQQYSIPRRRAGWVKEGASGDRVRYIHRFAARELAELLAAEVAAVRLRGAGFPLPYRFKLGPAAGLVERAWQRLPVGTAWADILVAVGRKRPDRAAP